MFKLLKIELIKALNNKTVWIIFALHFLLLAPIAFGFQGLLGNISFNMNGLDLGQALVGGFKVFDYPEVWQNIAYLASWFKLFLAIIIVVIVSNEYQFRTIKQNIIDGMSKVEIVLAKQLLILFLSLATVLFIVILVLILGKNSNNISIFNGSEYLLRYFISIILYLNFAYLLSTFIKKSGLTIGLLFLYTLIIENLISFKLPETITNLLPMNLIENLNPNPMLKFLGKNVADSFNTIGLIASAVYFVVFIVLIYWNVARSKFV